MAKFYTPTKLSENIRETPEGYLFCLNVPIARTGWQIYGPGETPLQVGKDNTVRIYRDAAEVFRPETIASLQGKSITIQHPSDFVKPANWSALTKGTAQNVRRGKEKDEDGEESLYADLHITDQLAIQLVRSGLREISCGYEAEYEQTGEGEGKQLNIVGNHIALVDQGRAGSAYAINDHAFNVKEGKSTMSKLAENMKKLFGKAVDEAMEEEKKDDKAKDAEGKKDEESEKSKDAASYDELVKMVKDLGEKIEGMAKGKDADESAKKEGEEEKAAKDADEKKPSEEAAKDAEEEGEKSMEERLKALEMAVSKLLESKAGDADESDKEAKKDDKAKDADEEESEDDDYDNSSLTGDTASRVEILSPGLKPKKGDDAKKVALEAAYNTKEGKAIIEALSGGKAMVLDSADKISTLFIATSEVLKSQRGTGLESTVKKVTDAKTFDDFDPKTQEMTPEKLNELYAAHWSQKAGK